MLFGNFLDLNGYDPKNNKVYRCILKVVNLFSKYGRTVALRNKTAQIAKSSFEKSLSFSKRKPILIETYDGIELSNKVFSNFSQLKKFKCCCRYRP